ncbi:hypothetical protein T265_12412 [Opisthorchis viverrini]|uniref:Uncharacterized protein n=1 Tax=Opisthorchis viverrini TaxID=6198 RepID=A0A074YTC8_OPIVI|nr:hypothetical protein T265_12412 [Opisthorchis viverrini]KER17978.1 hypothetical protein T265_12412 [Opisthorchis viverrini]
MGFTGNIECSELGQNNYQSSEIKYPSPGGERDNGKKISELTLTVVRAQGTPGGILVKRMSSLSFTS